MSYLWQDLSRESMKPSKLVRAYNQASIKVDKSLGVFERILKALSQRQDTMIQVIK